jgi:beta-barrel assembly-enhancing protease
MLSECKPMKSYYASYIQPGVAEPITATVLVFDNNLSIGYRNTDGSNEMLSWMIRGTTASFELSEQSTRLTNDKLPGKLVIEGREATEFINSLKAEQKKAWHKRRSGKDWVRGSIFFLSVIGLLFLLYLLIVPWLSERMASTVSAKTERQLGDAVYGAMGLNAKEDKGASLVINDFFNVMQVTTDYSIRISVIKDSIVNAFALPGGRIVIYTALLNKIGSYPELAALLSHEFTHVNNKHSTKSIFRRLGSKIFLGLLFGRLGSVTSVLIDHADDIKSLTYSRRLEKEADLEGLELLKQRKIDPAGFVSLMEHLKASAPGDNLPEFLGSHPDVDKRLAYLKESAKGAVVIENVQLKAIFEELKH